VIKHILQPRLDSIIQQSMELKFSYYVPPLIGGGIKRSFCLTFVCPSDLCRVHGA